MNRWSVLSKGRVFLPALLLCLVWGCTKKREEPACAAAVTAMAELCSACAWVESDIPEKLDCGQLTATATKLRSLKGIISRLPKENALLVVLNRSTWLAFEEDVKAMAQGLMADCVACIDAPPSNPLESELCPACFARPYNGRYMSKYPSGKQRESGHYRDGKKHGPWEVWFENGRLKDEAGFHNGKPDGRALGRDEAGRIASETNYRRGVLHGGRKRFKDGRIYEHAIFERDVPTGRWLTWHPNGRLKTQKDYETQCAPEACTSRLHGYVMAWDSEGKPTLLEKYVHGVVEKR